MLLHGRLAPRARPIYVFCSKSVCVGDGGGKSKMVIASLVPNFLMGIIIGAGLQGIFMLVGGYFRLPNDIPKPVWKYPLSYLSFNYWSIQGQFKNDLLGLEFDNGYSAFPPKLTGKQILEQFYQIDTKLNKWVDLAVIFAMVVMYRLLFLGMIKMKENLSPWMRGKIGHRSIATGDRKGCACGMIEVLESSIPRPLRQPRSLAEEGLEPMTLGLPSIDTTPPTH